jgi:hypothetical protein
MKKTTLSRKTAYLVPPQLADGFVPPVNFNYKISVSLYEVDIKIYGFTGISWELMYNSDGVLASFEAEVQHQKYYFESKTGAEQVVRVSFLSTENEESIGIRAGVTSETRKFYDIEEIPVYNGSKDGAMLTIMSNGTLSWLLASESFVVPSEGGEPADPGSSYLESSATLYGDANLSNGSLVLDGTGDYAVIDDGFRFTDRMTTSVWFKTSATGDRRIYSSHVRGMGGADWRNGFFARLNSGQLKYRHPAGGTGELTGPSGLNDGAWHHLALSWEAGAGYVLYVDGVQRGQGSSGASDGYAAGWGLYIGGNPWNNNNPYALFDGEIKKFEVLNEVLTAQQVTDRFNEGVADDNPIMNASETFSRANRDFVNFGDDVKYDRSTGEDFSAEVDVKFSSSPGANVYDIVGKGANDFSSGWSILAYTASGVPSLRMFANTSAAINGELGMNAAFAPVIGQWYTIKAVWKNTGVQELWIDGVKSAERSKATSYLPPIDSAHDLRLGEVFVTGTNRAFDGEMRNLKIFKGIIN